MGSSHHLKRLAMPRSWPLPRKTTVWIARPRPGAHSLERCIALSVVMRDLLEVADALTDILYVTYGAGHAFGINLDACFDEVQRSNMSKLDDKGKPIYNNDGIVMKGPNYFKPNLSKFLK